MKIRDVKSEKPLGGHDPEEKYRSERHLDANSPSLYSWEMWAMSCYTAWNAQLYSIMLCQASHLTSLSVHTHTNNKLILFCYSAIWSLVIYGRWVEDVPEDRAVQLSGQWAYSEMFSSHFTESQQCYQVKPTWTLPLLSVCWAQCNYYRSLFPNHHSIHPAAFTVHTYMHHCTQPTSTQTIQTHSQFRYKADRCIQKRWGDVHHHHFPFPSIRNENLHDTLHTKSYIQYKTCIQAPSHCENWRQEMKRKE